MSYAALFDVKGFAGYHLWWVRIRAKPNQRWVSAPMTGGRTDTEAQAHGAVAQALAGIGFGEIRHDASERWSVVRDRIRQPGDARRFEGFRAWAEWRGDRDALADAGREFQAGWRAELSRREDARRDAEMQGIEYARFCMVTGRDFLRRSDDDWSAFRQWQFDEIQRRNREAQEEYSHQHRDGPFLDFSSRPRLHADLAVLGLEPGASQSDIKTAWRRVAMRLHPDRGGDHGEFVKAKAAFERLNP